MKMKKNLLFNLIEQSINQLGVNKIEIEMEMRFLINVYYIKHFYYC